MNGEKKTHKYIVKDQVDSLDATIKAKQGTRKVFFISVVEVSCCSSINMTEIYHFIYTQKTVHAASEQHIKPNKFHAEVAKQ